MKKFLLSLAALAIAAGVNAEKVAFVMDGSQEFYTGDAKQVIVWTGQNTTENFPLSADFGQIKFSNAFLKVGAFRLKKGCQITITPVEGITISKITGRQQIPGQGKANCGLVTGFTYDEATQTQSVTAPITQAMTTATTEYETRFSWIEVEYSGTPTGVCPPVFESTFPVVPTDKRVTVKSATEGATYQYKVGAEGEWAAIPADGIKVQEPAIYYVKAVKGDKESAENATAFVPIAEGLKMATFTFNNWADMASDSEGKQFTKADLTEPEASTGNQWIDLANADATTTLKEGAATLSITKGTTNTRIFLSATLGGATDLRYYTKSVTTFGVEEGNELVAAVVNGGELNNYANVSTKTPSEYKNCECTVFPKSDNNWFLLMEKDDSFEPATSMSFTAGQGSDNKNYTAYLAHVYIFYRDLNGDSSVNEIAADENAPVEYYNLQGVRVANPANGLFIVKQGNKVSKRIIK